MVDLLNTKDRIAQSSVEVCGDTVQIDLEDGMVAKPLQSLPEDKIEWIEKCRGQAYDQLQKGGGQVLKSAAYHLPMITTYTAGATFPFNCCNKGVGFQPKREYLEECTEHLRNVHESTRGKPWRESATTADRSLSIWTRCFRSVPSTGIAAQR